MARSLVLITVDCFRADHAGFLGFKRNTTPFLDSLAKSSTVFSNAIVAGAPTYYSFPAIMASRHPLAWGRDVIGIAPEEPTIASALNQSGYATAAFLAANPYLSPQFGYDSGFDTFHDFLEVTAPSQAKSTAPATDSSRVSRFNSRLAEACHRLGPIGGAYDELYFKYCQAISERSSQSLDSLRRFPSADVIVNEASSWLENLGTEPSFLWLHLMDPHSPYYPKEEALQWMGDRSGASRARYANLFWNREDIGARRLRRRRDEIISLYDAGIRWVDAQIGRLVDKLRRHKLWDDCVFAVTADHGEEFLEHEGRYHSPAKLTEELIHVPLLLHVPESGASQIRTAPFSLVDLAPTLFAAMEISAPTTFRGTSRWTQSQETDRPNPPVIVEAIATCKNPFDPQQRIGPRIIAVRDSAYKLVVDFASSQGNLFSLKSDAGELAPLPEDADRPVRRRLLEYAKEHISQSICLRDTDRRLEAQLRGLRLECGDSIGRIVL
jgi:arylsulfatase A-like enzyme